MFAKLVTPTGLNACAAFRDIARLLTSQSPSLSLLSGFSQSTSVIYDAAPAGWTYVGGSYAADQPTIYNGSLAGFTTTADVVWRLCLSAPCLATTKLKYAVLTQEIGLAQASNGTTAVYGCLTGATNATSTGVVTNEGPRYFHSSTDGVTEGEPTALGFTANSTTYVIADQRHITIIQEGRGFSALWEHQASPLHLYSDTVPMVQYSHNRSDIFTRANIIVPTNSSAVISNTILAATFNSYRTSDANIAGTYDFTENMTRNLGNFIQNASTLRSTTIDQSGFPVYQVSPVWFQTGARGHPVVCVTGVVPVYFTAPSIGTTLDVVSISGQQYRWFNCGAGFGMAFLTGT